MRFHWHRQFACVASLASLLLLPACFSGSGSDARTRSARIAQSDLPVAGLCRNPDQPGSPTPIRMLSKRELSRTLRDILGVTLHTSLASDISLIPNDEIGIKFDHIGNVASFLHVEALFGLAESIATKIVADYRTFLGIGTCLTSTSDQACMGTFISTLGRKLFRRPVTPEEQTQLQSLYDTNRSRSKAEAAQLVIASMFQSPQFYYIVELSGAPSAQGEQILQLTQYEIATRLSFALKGSTPDDLLLAAAESGSLSTEEGIAAQASRILASVDSRNHFKEYIRQYLDLASVPALSYSSAYLGGLSTTGLAEQAIAEAQDYMLHHMIDQRKTFTELMTSRTSFVKTPQLAAVYGVSPSSSPSGEVLLPPERAGILTRVALLLTGEDDTKLFHRGKLLATEFNCQPIGRPDPEAVPEAFATLESPANLSTRQFLHQLTSPSLCVTCHSVMNPYGFALENFDGVGRFRTFESRLATDGTVLRNFPIDSRAEPLIDGKPQAVSGPADLAHAIASSEQAKECFSRKWFRFSLAKQEKMELDGCSIESLKGPLDDSTAGISGMITGIFKLKDFRLRVRPSR